jgi:hypothetical protein
VSWPYVAAAWRVRVTPTQKLTLLALSDQADMRGRVIASNAELRKLTGLSEQSIRRALRQLRSLVEQTSQGFASATSCYQLKHASGGATVVGGATAAGGAKSQGGEVPQRSDSSYLVQIPISRKAVAPAAPRSQSSDRKEKPTRDQVAKLVHTILDDPLVVTGDVDLVDAVKTACARAGFIYDRAVVDDGIARALAGRRNAR